MALWRSWWKWVDFEGCCFFMGIVYYGDNNLFNMAVSKEDFTEVDGKIKLTNGDFQALKKIAADYGLTDESDVIAFALGILNRAKGKAISVEQDDGSTIRFIPSDKLRSKIA